MNDDQLNDQIESARRREENDDHLTDRERQALVKAYEAAHADSIALGFTGYPANSTVTAKFIHIIYGE